MQFLAAAIKKLVAFLCTARFYLCGGVTPASGTAADAGTAMRHLTKP